MNRNDLNNYKIHLASLSEEEKTLRDLFLRELAIGELQGPSTGVPSIDKPWIKHYEDQAIKVESPKCTAYEYLCERNKNNLDYIAINFFDKRITYRKMFQYIDDAAQSLSQMGVKKGDYVTFCVPTIPETIYLFYALNKIGAAGNFIDLRTNPERILKYINMTDSKVVVAFHNVLGKVKSILPESTASFIVDIDVTDSLPFIKKTLYSLKVKDPYEGEYDEHIIRWKSFIKNGKRASVQPLGEYNDFPVAIVYTGGTTGEPKGAVLSNESLNMPCIQYANADIPRGNNDVFVNIMPPFIAYGLVDGVHLPLSLGMEALLMPKFDAREFSQILKKYKPAHFIGIPSHYDILMKDPRTEGMDLSFVKNAGCGGDTIPPALEISVNKFLKEHNCENYMRLGYGLTENAAMSIFDVNNKVTKTGSTGIPMQKMNIGVFEESGNELPYGETGELWIKSPAAIMGYYGNEIESKNIFAEFYGEKWIKTGDYAKIDEDGNVFLMGRKRVMFTRPDGHNVFPEMISNNLSGCPIVDDVCVVGIRSIHNEHGKIPTAIVVLKDQTMDYESAKREILEYQSHLLGDRDGAIDVRFRKELPVTPIGKIDVLRIEEEENRTPSDIDFETLIALKK